MSDAPRMPLERASAAAALLMAFWHMPGDTCMACGSVRRRSPQVGDLDLVAPLPAAGAGDRRGQDHLFDAIDKTAKRPGVMFEDPAAFTEVIQGLKPGFLEARLRVQLRGVVKGREEETVSIPVQVCRYTPENRGWMELMKTGPRDFNIWFLGQWKRKQGIPQSGPDGEGGLALVSNHLVDPWGKVVPVRTERQCFDLCGLGYIEPEVREAHAAEQQRQRRLAGRDALR